MERLGIHSPGALAAIASAAAVARLEGLDPPTFAARLRAADALTPIHPYRAFAEGANVKLLYGAFGQALGLSVGLQSDDPAGATARASVPALTRRRVLRALRGRGVAGRVQAIPRLASARPGARRPRRSSAVAPRSGAAGSGRGLSVRSENLVVGHA